jgi:ABC-2 type transport system permease protein
MRFSKAWVVASKDLAIFRRKRSILYSLVIVPIMVSILFPTVLLIAGRNGGKTMTPEALGALLPSFAFFWLILAGVIPTTLASYSIVGEKVEKCLEPLLATPTTDGEILLGKGIAAFLPPIVAILGGATLFMALVDLVTQDTLGYLYFPNWNEGIVLFVMVPIAAMMSVEWNIIISSRVSDVRIAQQVGALLVLPLGLIYVAGEVRLVDLGDTTNLLIISGVMAAVVVLLLPIARATFNREQILTHWR